ncbi:MAG TPA: shikimate dehydrogenase [Gammaproteobacteria bacterium]|nr:shikimate dehydrogenase [Gammaproteobacteria bacterium]
MQKNEAPPDRYAVVGYPVAHSKSPLIHQLFARQTGQHMTYELLEAEPEDFETAVRGFGAAGGKGLNVTVPHKEAAFALVDEISETANTAGAVNTVSIVDGKLRGDNTDGVGFIRDVTVNHRQPLARARVLVLGAGGAARGIMGPLLETEPLEVVIANRTQERADRLVAQLGSPPALRAAAFSELAALSAFDVVINATSAGLKGEIPPFPATLVGPKSFCYDMVYSVHDTPFVVWARQHGAARAVQGWGMLIEQAAESFFIWRGVRPDTRPIRKQLAGQA